MEIHPHETAGKWVSPESEALWKDLLRSYSCNEWDHAAKVADRLLSLLDHGALAPVIIETMPMGESFNWWLARAACEATLTEARACGSEIARNSPLFASPTTTVAP